METLLNLDQTNTHNLNPPTAPARETLLAIGPAAYKSLNCFGLFAMLDPDKPPRGMSTSWSAICNPLGPWSLSLAGLFV